MLEARGIMSSFYFQPLQNKKIEYKLHDYQEHLEELVNECKKLIQPKASERQLKIINDVQDKNYMELALALLLVSF